MDAEDSDFVDVFQWSSTEYDLKKFHQDYKNQFPCLVRITSGYAGAAEQQMNEIGIGEMYWIFGVQKQKRIVAKNKNDLYISIPLESNFRFQTIDRKEPLRPPGPPVCLKQLLPPGKGFQGQQIIFEDDQAVSFLMGADAGSRTHFGRLELLDSYNEKYLLAISIIENSVYGVVLGIPVYMPVQLVVAVGLCDHPFEHFTKWLEQLNDMCRSVNQRTIEPCKEILLFDEAPITDYEYIEPRSKLHITESKKEDERSSAQVRSRHETAPDHVEIDTESSLAPWAKQQSRMSDSMQSRNCVPTAKKVDEKKLVQDGVTELSKDASTGSWLADENDVNTDDIVEQRIEKVRSEIEAPPPKRPPRNYTQEVFVKKGVHPKAKQNAAPKNNGKHATGSTPSVTVNSSATPGSHSGNKSLLSGLGELTLKTEHTGRVGNLAKPTNMQKVLPMLSDSSSFAAPGIVKGDSAVNPDTYPLTETALPRSNPTPVIETVIPNTIHRYIEAIDPQISNPVECSPEDSTKSSSVNIASSAWTDLNDLPPVDMDLAKLSIDEVHRCVKMIAITGEKADLLKDANVNGTLLLNLDVDRLVNDFGFGTFDAKKLMMFAKDGWRPKTTRGTIKN